MTMILRRINTCWRVFSTGLSFTFFGIGGVLLTAVICPLMVIFERDVLIRQYKAQLVIQRMFKLFLWFIRWSGTARIELVGMDAVKNDRGCLIVANHPSLIDYVMISSCLRQCDCIVKTAIFSNPCMKGIVKTAGYVSNEDVSLFVEACAERLHKGHVLLVFPEGTRTTPGKTSTLVRGAAQIAAHAKVDLRLVHITVTPSFLTKEHKWYNVPDIKPVFRVEAKGMIAVEPFLREASSVNAAARRLTRHLDDVLFPKEERMKVER
jgi:1-acyl-sn-glycerol-3-phosphate acyltransferase